ncbi:hypothetical protein CR513_48934, partial [Mucuna pruriens]
MSGAKASKFDNFISSECNIVDLDVILGMDLLSSNQIMFDCAKRPLSSSTLRTLGFITTSQAEAALNKGVQGYMILSFLEVKNCLHMNFMAIVKDFLEVFSDKVLGLPP